MNARDFAKQRALIERRYTSKRQRSKAMSCLMRRAGASLVVVNGRMVNWHLRTGETVCVKERFTTELNANLALVRIQAANDNGHRTPIRVYACRRCHGWHLTSQPPKYLEKN